MAVIEISNEADLRRIGEDWSLSDCYELTGDIRITSAWKSLCNAVGLKLDGKGFTISGLDTPLFSTMNNSAVSNLRLQVGIFTNVSTVGGLMESGQMNVLDRLIVEGEVQGESQVGGLAGVLVNSALRFCVNRARIFGGRATGGLVGYGMNTVTNRCVNEGNVQQAFGSQQSGAGPLIGLSHGGGDVNSY